ncbi:MAG TPA: hypothetical protein VNZ52_00355, partial [Candidatus Thermoplasmatota archaeon]|nr:hypothetical protein [Candidatus Thermoplasmatota archaeon]
MRAARAIVGFLVLALALPALAGCFGEEPAPVTTFAATGSDLSFSEGWAYDGTGIVKATGNITIAVDDATDQGAVTATLQLGENATYAVSFTSFAGAPDKPFQNGGIALN